ncbi:MAG: OsmC family protein [Gammaproteobacteria bacterium]|nr:OsmC family protein [Gammaproteobacteria bacterium]
MSEYYAQVLWRKADSEIFTDSKYSRAHSWNFDGGARVAASASPDIVPLPYSVAANVDPEEAFVASLSSCHMLFFLSIAAKYQFVVEQYVDNAVGFMQKTTDGKMAMTRVVLRPEVRFSEGNKPDRQKLEQMHHQSHESCFIANSVKTVVETEIIC